MKNILKKLKSNDLVVLDQQVFSEIELRTLANLLNFEESKSIVVRNLVSQLPVRGRNFDWNVGSILQHIEVSVIIDVLKKNTDPKLFNSIGLVWALGEFKNTNRVITDFLYNTIKNSVNSDTWWRAAFSLEKLGLEEAVNLLKMSLKTTKLQELDYYLHTLGDKRSIISILILSNVENIERIVYPKIKKYFLETQDDAIIINCCWLIGRLKLIDKEIYEKLLKLISHNNYELKYYTFFALQNNATEPLRLILEKALSDADPLIRKMATRGLMSIGNAESLAALHTALYKEFEEAVVSEISNAIYHLKNPTDRSRLLLGIKLYRNENGMISDESDKWYHDPSIYHVFSEAEDPENLCFSLIQKHTHGKKIQNPVDLASGTGRMMWQIINKMPFSGTLFAVDASEQMCDFISKTIKRERKFTSNIEIVQHPIIEAPKSISVKSTFVISSFGFPSKISNTSLCMVELQAVYDLLTDDGLFFTIGWDETFNDELNHMWYKFIPDNIAAQDFEEWRQKRSAAIQSPRNCGLTWLKKGISVPLQFESQKEAAFVMGYLFGRDAVQHIVNTGKTEWNMSLGITCNTRKELEAIIKSYERN
jgi:HEAT repeat protein